MRRWKINKFYKFKYKECKILLILLCIHSRKSQGSITFSRFTGNYNLTLEGGQLSSLITRFQKNPISLSKCVSWLNTFQIQSAIREKKWHVFLSLLFMTIPIIIQAAFLGPWSRQVVTEVKIRPFFTAAELFYGLLLWFPNCILSKPKKSMNDDSQLFAYTSKIRKTESWSQVRNTVQTAKSNAFATFILV